MSNRKQEGGVPEFEPNGKAAKLVPGEEVSAVNAAIEEHNWSLGRSSRRGFMAKGAAMGIGATALAAAVSACGDSSEATATTGDKASGPNREGITISYPQESGSSIAFFQPITAGAKQAASDLGVKLDYRATGATKPDLSAGQARLTAAAVATKPTGIMTGFWDVDAMAEPIERAVREGIIVVTLNATPDVNRPSLGAVTFVGQDDIIAGAEAARRFMEAGLKKALILNHDPAQVNISNRVKGFKDAFEGETHTVITPIEDPTGSANRIKASLASQSGVDSMMSTAAPQAEFAVKALDSIGRTDIKLGTFEYNPTLLDAIAQRKVMFAIDQAQYLQGYYPVLIITLMKSLGFAPVRPWLTGPVFVTEADALRIKEEADAGRRGG
jgi:simple sugar transport system substrate-binding protein